MAAPLRFAGRSRGLAAPNTSYSDTGSPRDSASSTVIECRRGLERAVQGALRCPASSSDGPVFLSAVSRAYCAAPAGRRAVTAALGSTVSESASADVVTWALRLRAAAAKGDPTAAASEGPSTLSRVAAWNADACERYTSLLNRVTSDQGAAVSTAGRNLGSSSAVADDMYPSWLLMRCRGLAIADSGGAMSGAELALSALSLLTDTSRGAEDLQGDLFDMFGADFDAVQDVLSRRDVIVQNADEIFAACSQAEELRAAGYEGANEPSVGSRTSQQSVRGARGKRGRWGRLNPVTPSERDPSSMNAMFTVTDAREAALRKQARKTEERAIRAGLIPLAVNGNAEEDVDVPLPNLGGSAMAELQKAFPGIALDGRTMIGGTDRVGLPLGSIRRVEKGYEEIEVPPPRGDLLPPTRLVNVSEALAMHPELLDAMRGVKTLNRLQSAVFPAAFESNENLLVCAPTGAGKTNVALLTILREIVAVKEGRQRDFKVVYVAPMKALAAEVVEKFSTRLRPLGLLVREFTGDISLTRKEAIETHVLVTTPEKWDVVTRKSGSELSDAVTLFIIDEVHLLHDDRGAVLESIVARTLRLSEAAQRVIRLVGLSATLPNYEDVAAFMRVNPKRGLFHFDGTYRPVPLLQTFVGVSEGGTSNSGDARKRRTSKMLEVAWSKAKDVLRRGHQAMIFVHSRKATSTTAREIVETSAKEEAQELLFGCQVDRSDENKQEGEEVRKVLPTWASKELSKSRTQDIRELCSKGVGIHHAGLPRSDRKLVEKLFAEGAIRLLCCTATLAWGVNLPARAVIILGTDVYDAQKGGFVQLGMLDVMQIFGRAGRPQFDTEGEGTIITKHENLARYLNLLTSSIPIESTLGSSASTLADHLNAEIVSGTVASIGDGVTWLSYTYLSVRMPKNPLVYGIDWDEVAKDPGLHFRRATLVEQAARALDDARMCRYDPRTASLTPTELGRIASHFYVSHRTVVLWNELLSKLSMEGGMSDAAWEEMDATVLHAVSCASEFEQMRSREEELEELDSLSKDACCVRLKSGPESREGKVNILLQSYISRASVRMSDLSYVVQSLTRLLRALFEIALSRGLPSLSLSALEMARASETQVWPFQHPLWQFCNVSRRGEHAAVQAEIVSKLDDLGQVGELYALRGMDIGELTDLLRSPRYASVVQQAVRYVPTLEITNASVAPITRTVLRVKVELLPSFTWKESVHGNIESWWLWVEDHEHDRIYHSKKIMLTKGQVQAITNRKLTKDEPEDYKGMKLELVVPVFDPPSAQYWVRIESERWHTGGGSTALLSLRNLTLPQHEPPHTELLDLRPLEVASVLKPSYAALYTDKFAHFNPIQTQTFHPAYHTNENMLIGAPAGSGKTIVAELAILRAYDVAPGECVVYVSPIKALVRERAEDWKRRLGGGLGKRLLELTGDTDTVDARALQSADIIVATPEKWDVVSRRWQRRAFARSMSLLILDEVHLLGSERGLVLEGIVSRARKLSPALGSLQTPRTSSQQPHQKSAVIAHDVRIVALSTPLANARELADWLGVRPQVGLFNFRPSVRPLPCS